MPDPSSHPPHSASQTIHALIALPIHPISHTTLIPSAPPCPSHPTLSPPPHLFLPPRISTHDRPPTAASASPLSEQSGDFRFLFFAISHIVQPHRSLPHVPGAFATCLSDKGHCCSSHYSCWWCSTRLVPSRPPSPLLSLFFNVGNWLEVSWKKIHLLSNHAHPLHWGHRERWPQSVFRDFIFHLPSQTGRFPGKMAWADPMYCFPQNGRPNLLQLPSLSVGSLLPAEYHR